LRILRKLDIYPTLRIAKLIFQFFVVAHVNACIWWWVGKSYFIFNFDTDPSQNSTTPWMLRMESLGYQQLYPDEERAKMYGDNMTSYEVIYLTTLYWSLLMLLKSPHIDPDHILEKLFACVVVVLALFVFAKLVAEVTGLFLAFDKSNRAFRDQQSDMARFAASRGLKPQLKKRLLQFSLADWAVNQNADPGDVLKSSKIPTYITTEVLKSVHIDVLDCSFMKAISKPILNEMLKYLKVCISLPKEVLIHQADVTMALFILKSGSLQAAAVEQAYASTGRNTDGSDNKGPKTKQTKLNRQSTSWKQKLQVKMIEVPGSLICCYNPYTPPKPLPFTITSLSKSLLVYMNLNDLLHVFNLCSAEQVRDIIKVMQTEHTSITSALLSRQDRASTRASARGGEVGVGQLSSVRGVIESERINTVDEVKHYMRRTSIGEAPPSFPNAGPTNLSEAYLTQLENDVTHVCARMTHTLQLTRQLPRMVRALAEARGVAVSDMGPLAGGGAIGSAAQPGTPSVVKVTSLSEPPTPHEADS